MKLIVRGVMTVLLVLAVGTATGCKKDAAAGKAGEAAGAKKDEAKKDEAKKDEAKTDEAKPDEAKPDEAKPEAAAAAGGSSCDDVVANMKKIGQAMGEKDPSDEELAAFVKQCEGWPEDARGCLAKASDQAGVTTCMQVVIQAQMKAALEEAQKAGAAAGAAGGEAAPAGGEAAPAGGEAAPAGGEAAPAGGEAAPAGGEAAPAPAP